MPDRTIKAGEVMDGDLIDLEHVGEPYVSAEDAEHHYAFEYAIVQGYHRESTETEDGTVEGIIIDFDSTTIAFPLDFELTCAGNLGDRDKTTKTL